MLSIVLYYTYKICQIFSCRPMSTILLLYYILRFFEISKLVDREPDQDIKLGHNMNWLFPSQAWIYYSTSFIGTLQTFRSQGKTCMKMGTYIKTIYTLHCHQQWYYKF